MPTRISATAAPATIFRKLLPWSLAFVTLGALADFVTTWHFVGHRGGAEAVPLSRWVIAHFGWPGFFAFKILLVPCFYYILPPVAYMTRIALNLFRPRNSRQADVAGETVQIRVLGLCGVAVLFFAASMHNLEIVDLSWFFGLFGADV